MDQILRKNIIKDLELDKLPAEEQEKALLSMGRIIFQSVMIRVLEKLNEKDKEEFEKMLSEKPADGDAILIFLQSRIPNINEIINEEIALFKRESVDFIKGLKKIN